VRVPFIDRLAEKLDLAGSVVDSGAAQAKLAEWAAATNR
jgi:anthranilate phosphoribosyltransferase